MKVTLIFRQIQKTSVKQPQFEQNVKRILIFQPEGEDDLKKMQLMELAILNGTYRDSKLVNPAALGFAGLAGLQRKC